MDAYLVTVDGLRGPEAQIWYGLLGQFTGRTDHAVAKMKLPDREAWTIDAALAWAIANPDAPRIT